MRIAYFDCFSGASGDMIVGALVDAGWPATELEASIAQLGIADCRVAVAPVVKRGVAATLVSFAFADQPHSRKLGELCDIVDQSALAEAIKSDALRVLRRLGTAEAKVHGLDVSADEVHLHELGSLDTVCDVVGAVAGLAALSVDTVRVSPLNLGGGTVHTAHGVLPVPAPAVAELVRGLPVMGGAPSDGELVTPTGAALLSTLAGSHGPLPPMSVERVGYGAGQRNRPVPNVLRLWLGEASTEPDYGEELALIETNVDDMSPELCAPLIERLLAIGALDAYWQPIVMKKGRPALLLGVLARADRIAAIEEAIFAETTTLGIRHHLVRRRMLDRDHVTVDTPYGPVAVKLGLASGKAITVAPEFEDCRRLAEARQVPLRVVYDAAKLSYYAADRAKAP